MTTTLDNAVVGEYFVTDILSSKTEEKYIKFGLKKGIKIKLLFKIMHTGDSVISFYGKTFVISKELAKEIMVAK